MHQRILRIDRQAEEKCWSGGQKSARWIVGGVGSMDRLLTDLWRRSPIPYSHLRQSTVRKCLKKIIKFLKIFFCRPANGGRPCEGPGEDSELCSTQPCPQLNDFRAEQCPLIAQLNSMNVSAQSLTWLPFEMNNRELNFLKIP